MRKANALTALLLLCGCTAHSPWNQTSRQHVELVAGATAHPAHERKVFVTSAEPAATEYKLLARIDVTKVWYGEREPVLDELADMARELGADAVISAKTWLQPAGWAWASPQGSGIAVLLTDAGRAEIESLAGAYR